MYFLYYNVNTGFLETSTTRHLKSLPDRKKVTTYLNSARKTILGLRTSVRVTKNANYFLIKCIWINATKLWAGMTIVTVGLLSITHLHTSQHQNRFVFGRIRPNS